MSKLPLQPSWLTERKSGTEEKCQHPQVRPEHLLMVWGFRSSGLGFGVWGFGFWVLGLGFGVWGLGLGV